MIPHKIWDPFLRLFHWSLVVLFTANALVLDEEGAAHERVGYAILVLVGLRLVWGFVGPKSARFASFLPGTAAVMGQLADIATRRRRAHLGHSPLGALMLVNLLAVMLALGLTGWMMTTHAFWGVEWVEELHEILFAWAGLSVIAHVAAVMFESWRTGVNLPRAMVTGTKCVPDDIRIVE